MTSVVTPMNPASESNSCGTNKRKRRRQNETKAHRSQEKKRRQLINGSIVRLKELVPYCEGKRTTIINVLSATEKYVAELKDREQALQDEVSRLRAALGMGSSLGPLAPLDTSAIAPMPTKMPTPSAMSSSTSASSSGSRSLSSEPMAVPSAVPHYTPAPAMLNGSPPLALATPMDASPYAHLATPPVLSSAFFGNYDKPLSGSPSPTQPFAAAHALSPADIQAALAKTALPPLDSLAFVPPTPPPSHDSAEAQAFDFLQSQDTILFPPLI